MSSLYRAKHLKDLQNDWKNKERYLKQQCKELTEKLNEAQKQVTNEKAHFELYLLVGKRN